MAATTPISVLYGILARHNRFLIDQESCLISSDCGLSQSPVNSPEIPTLDERSNCLRILRRTIGIRRGSAPNHTFDHTDAANIARHPNPPDSILMTDGIVYSFVWLDTVRLRKVHKSGTVLNEGN
jgi:hypothetical protein